MTNHNRCIKIHKTLLRDIIFSWSDKRKLDFVNTLINLANEDGEDTHNPDEYTETMMQIVRDNLESQNG